MTGRGRAPVPGVRATRQRTAVAGVLDSLDGFRFVALTGDDPAAGAAQLIDAWAGESTAAACDAYVAGGDTFRRACASAFREAGVPEARLFSEVV